MTYIKTKTTSRILISALLSLILAITSVTVLPPAVAVSSEISPDTLQLYVQNEESIEEQESAEDLDIKVPLSGTTPTVSQAPGLYLKFTNSTTLNSRTREIIAQSAANGDKFAGLTVQVQLKTNSDSWKTYKVGDFNNINYEDEASEIKLLSGQIPDLTQNTAYAKIRYAWVTEKGSVQYGAWSETSAIGKEADLLEQPPLLDSPPAFTKVYLDFNEAEYPQFNLVTGTIPQAVTDHSTNAAGRLMLNVMLSENGGEDRCISFVQASNLTPGETFSCSILDEDQSYSSGNLTLKARFEWYDGGVLHYGEKTPDLTSSWTQEYSADVLPWSNATSWAITELTRAYEHDLIPTSLLGHDLAKNITRAEFAAVAVKAYETLSGIHSTSMQTSPFADCTDTDVLKAYTLGIVNGISATTFDPKAGISREQAAVMLTRVHKLLTMDGWSLANDNQFKLDYTMPAAFSDDRYISDFARDSVYFLSANKIMNGLEGNVFAPKNITYSQKKKGYANTTRQQAIIMALRMMENLPYQIPDSDRAEEASDLISDNTQAE